MDLLKEIVNDYNKEYSILSREEKELDKEEKILKDEEAKIKKSLEQVNEKKRKCSEMLCRYCFSIEKETMKLISSSKKYKNDSCR